MENQETTTPTDQTKGKGKGDNLGNKSIANKDLTINQRVEIFVSMYAKLEAAKALLIANGFTEDKQMALVDTQSVKEKVKEMLDKYSNASGLKLTSDKVETLQGEIEKLLNEKPKKS